VSARFRLTGAREMEKRFVRSAKGQATKEFARAAFQELQYVELPEIKRSTPVDKGPLRGSEKVTEPEVHGFRIWLSIVAGGPAAPYAYWVHEDPEALHAIGGWKFIERPLLESAPFMGARIARRIDLNKVVS
jgi:hypothetical protein